MAVDVQGGEQLHQLFLISAPCCLQQLVFFKLAGKNNLCYDHTRLLWLQAVN